MKKVLGLDIQRALCNRIIKRDREAFERLWVFHEKHLTNYLKNKINSQEIREDVMQRTALQMWRKMHTFKGNIPIHYWTFSIAINEMKMIFKKEAKYLPVGGAGQTEDLPDDTSQVDFISKSYHQRLELCTHKPESPLDQRVDAIMEVQRIGAHIKNHMPISYRKPFLLHVVGDVDTKDVANLMGISLAAVKSRVHRARLGLHQERLAANG